MRLRNGTWLFISVEWRENKLWLDSIMLTIAKASLLKSCDSSRRKLGICAHHCGGRCSIEDT